MPLALLEQEFDNVDIELQWFQQAYAIERWSLGRRLSDTQSGSFTEGHDFRDWPVAIEHRNRLAALDSTQVLAQAGLQLCDANLLHDYIMTRDGQ